MSAIIRRILLSSGFWSGKDDVFHRQVGLLSGILAVFIVGMAAACQSTGPTATPRIQPEDIVIEARPTATPTTPAVMTTAPTPTVLTAANTPVPTATLLPTEVSVAPSPTQPSLIATVTPNPTFEALRATPTAEPTATPDPDPLRERKVFRVPISNIIVPDPVFADYGWSSELQYEIFAGLTTFTPDESNPVQLDMATSHTVSSGGSIHTFILRPGLKFSDGSPLTASDFKWSWERALRTAARVEVATQAEWVLAPILGAQEILAGEASELVGVEAVDERTLTVELAMPRSDIGALLAHPAAAVLKRDNVEAWDIDWSRRVSATETVFSFSGAVRDPGPLPIGAGPFKLTTYDEVNEQYVIERNDHYHGELATLDAVILDAKAFIEAYDSDAGPFVGIDLLIESGEIDAGINPTFVTGSADGDSLPVGIAKVGVNPTTMLIVFNPSIPPFDNLDFRRALAAAVDTDSFLETFGGARATGIVPPSDPGYSESSFPIEYDLVAAESSFDAFQQSNQGFLDEIPWIFGSSGTRERERVAIASGWQVALPVNFSLELVSSTREFQRLRRTNELPLMLIRHQTTYPHPQASVIDFQELFGESAESEELEQIKEMTQRAASEADLVTALDLYAQLEQHLLDNALVVPLSLSAGTKFYVRVQPWVHGYQVGRYGGSRFKDVWFDETYPGPRLSVTQP